MTLTPKGSSKVADGDKWFRTGALLFLGVQYCLLFSVRWMTQGIADLVPQGMGPSFNADSKDGIGRE
jgi:hypothetical protein